MSIMVDVDEKIEPRDVATRVRFVENVLGWRIKLQDVKETARGYHMLFDVPKKLSNRDIIILQLLLGSDYHREAFNYRRVLNGEKNWNIFFMTKFKKVEKNGKYEWEVVSQEKECLLWRIMYEIEFRTQSLKRCISEYISQVWRWKF